MRHRIVLCGFSEFECRAMKFSFQHSEVQFTGFDLVYMLGDADFAVVDADSEKAVDTVIAAGRERRAVFVGSVAPPNAAAHLRRPIAPASILKALRHLEMQHRAPVLGRAAEVVSPGARSALESTQGKPLSVKLEIVASHEEAMPRSEPARIEPIESGPRGGAPDRQSGAPHQDAKAARRGAVRRAWLTRVKRRNLSMPGPVSRDVLVLDAESIESASLCELLTRFGFDVTPVRSVTEARAAMEARFFAAYFLDITLDVGDGVGLLQSIHDQAQPAGHEKPEVLMVVSQLQPADRVRAALAGIGTPLLKPVTRGDLARALESRGVALPADARRI